jgi:hypothetical protein
MRTKNIVDNVAYLYWEIAADSEAVIASVATVSKGLNECHFGLEKMEVLMSFESGSVEAEEVQEGELYKVHQ